MKLIGRLSFLLLFIALQFSACDEKETEEYHEAYIVGSFIGNETDQLDGLSTDDQTPRGYCILFKESENASEPWPMDMYTFSLPDDLFKFPEEILTPNYNNMNCGPTFFPDSLQKAYPILFRYRLAKENEYIHFSMGLCFALDPAFPWHNYQQIVLEDISVQTTNQ